MFLVYIRASQRENIKSKVNRIQQQIDEMQALLPVATLSVITISAFPTVPQ
jgi:hypothetical protein